MLSCPWAAVLPSCPSLLRLGGTGVPACCAGSCAVAGAPGPRQSWRGCGGLAVAAGAHPPSCCPWRHRSRHSPGHVPLSGVSWCHCPRASRPWLAVRSSAHVKRPGSFLSVSSSFFSKRLNMGGKKQFKFLKQAPHVQKVFGAVVLS